MAPALRRTIGWIAVVSVMLLAALALAAGMAALLMFAFVIYHLVFQIGLANRSSLGVGALFVSILGAVWLIGNSLIDFVAGSNRSSRRNRTFGPWLGVLAAIGVLFFMFGE